VLAFVDTARKMLCTCSSCVLNLTQLTQTLYCPSLYTPCPCRQSGGKLPLFVDGIRALASGLTAGDRVLIAEACNHNRITDHCNDIGMVQIPGALQRVCGKGLVLEHAFGRCELQGFWPSVLVKLWVKRSGGMWQGPDVSGHVGMRSCGRGAALWP
jgi:hypothetical protein